MGCMGIAAADFDGNGRTDLHVTNFENEWSNQYMQDEEGFFEDLVVSMGLDESSYAMVGFGTQAIDYDNNRSIDLVVGNGHIDDHTREGRGFEMPTMMLTRDGPGFRQQIVRGDSEYWDAGHLSRALATCDWNRDGRTDIVVTDLMQPFVLLENQTPTDHHWIELQLVGTTSERDSIGATATLRFGGSEAFGTANTGDGYMAKNEAVLHFGLGTINSVDRLEIRWPSGREQVLRNLPADKRWLVVEGEEVAFSVR